MFRDDKKSSDLPLVMMVLAGGLILRLLWVDRLLGGPATFQQAGEATLVAQALAEGRGFADAYFQGSGPTAHLSPAVPLVPGFLLWLFGQGGSASNLVLLGWSLFQVSLAYLLGARLMKLLDAGRPARLLGLMLLCLVPVYVEQETIDFRWWEGASALCLGLINLNFLLQMERQQEVTDRTLLLVAALLSCTAFLSPPVGLACGACWAYFALRRLDWAQKGKLAVAGAVVMAVLVVPWAIRNQQQLGSSVLLRSNSGLEIALANHADALSSTRSPRTILIDRVQEIHPFMSRTAREAQQAAGGEVAYSKRLGEEAWEWIRANPSDFGRLSLRHLSQFYFPKPWQMEFSAWDDFRPWRAHWIAMVNLVGLLALGLSVWGRRSGYIYAAIYIAVVAIPYMIVQPTPRYTYLVYVPLAYFAADGLMRALAGLRRGFRAQTASSLRSIPPPPDPTAPHR